MYFKIIAMHHKNTKNFFKFFYKISCVYNEHFYPFIDKVYMLTCYSELKSLVAK